jgi:urea carboxylase-associated protein 2
VIVGRQVIGRPGSGSYIASLADRYPLRDAAVSARPILDTTLAPGAGWSRVCRRGTALTLVDLEGGANVPALLYRAGDPLERYCMPDTLKAQHVCRLTAGVALYSDMGRVLASITGDTCGWHDTLTGHATAETVAERWGYRDYQAARNEWRRSARDTLLVELAKHGLAARDLVATINFFAKVAVGSDGELEFVSGHSRPGASVTIRFELDSLVVLTSGPHPLDPASEWPARRVGLRLELVDPPGEDDPVRCACPENRRGFSASEAVLA